MALRPHPPVLRPAIAPSSLRAALPPPPTPPVSSRPGPAPALALRQASLDRDTDSARPQLARAWIPPPSSRAPRLRPPPLPRGRWTQWGEGGYLLSNANTRPHRQSNSLSSPPFQTLAYASGVSADINRTEKEVPLRPLHPASWPVKQTLPSPAVPKEELPPVCGRRSVQAKREPEGVRTPQEATCDPTISSLTPT